MSSPAHQVLSSAYTKVCNSNYKASQWFTSAGETLTKQEKTGYKEWNVADQKLCQSLPSLLLSSLLQVLPAGKESKNSFGTCSEKSLSFPEGNLSVWGILAAALHLHRHHREGAAGSATPLLTTPFGLLLQEWGPEHVLLLGPDFSWCTCNFSCLLITPPLAVAFSHRSSGTHLSWTAKVQSGASGLVSPAGGSSVRSPAVSSSLVHFPSPAVQGDHSVPDCSEVTHKGGDRYLWKAFSRKLASFSQSS